MLPLVALLETGKNCTVEPGWGLDMLLARLDTGSRAVQLAMGATHLTSGAWHSAQYKKGKGLSRLKQLEKDGRENNINHK